jgi:hypothetical protein
MMKNLHLSMFKSAMALLIIVFLSAGNLTAQTPQFYNYSNGTSYNSFPFNQAAGKMIQTLVAPGEYNQPIPATAGNITKWYFRVSTGYPLGPATYTSFKVLFCQSAITALPASLFTGTWDTVYQRASVTITGGADTWVELTLDHPFNYNPAQSLVIQIEQCAASGTIAGFSAQHTATAVNRRTYSAGGCPFAYGGTSLYVLNNGITVTAAIQLPDLLYYKFKNNTAGFTPNFAIPGVGSNPAPVLGSIVPGGQFDSAYLGAGVASNGVTPGWNLNVGTSSWTISMWVEIPSSTSGSAFYLFGDGGSGSFRCFHNGVALQDGMVLRGTGITDVTVTGIGPAATVVHFVYDSAAANIKAYKNGVLFSTIAQTPLNIVTGTGFKVGGYTTSANLMGKLDEFRFYKRALGQAEITATWNQNLGVITGVTPISTEIPSEYKLSQNYPNPFNPVTKINYSLPKSGFVTMKIYDMLGREVVKLVSEKKVAGNYSVDFNASNLTSGVYFYRLEVNGFVDTKKMMLVK